MFRKLITLFLLTTSLLLTACGSKDATISPEAFYTQSAQTAEVAEALTAMAGSPTPSITPTLEITKTPEVSLTPTGGATSTHWPTGTSRPPSGSPCDNALYLNVQTPPDFSTIPAGSTFTVSWRFRNLGPCEWNTDYHIVFSYVSDTGKDGVFKPPAPENFPETTLPTEDVDISIILTAPTKADGYQVVFRLQNDKGFFFGPEFWIIFSVE